MGKYNPKLDALLTDLYHDLDEILNKYSGKKKELDVESKFIFNEILIAFENILSFLYYLPSIYDYNDDQKNELSKYIAEVGDAIERIRKDIIEKVPNELDKGKEILLSIINTALRLCNAAEEVSMDPVSPEVVQKMKERGMEVLPHPICVLSKVSQGLSRDRAEEECIAEGKLHPISIILSRTVD